jgi:uncharacterized membrane protein
MSSLPPERTWGPPLGGPKPGLAPDTLIALSYVGGWPTGVFVWLVEREDPRVRFHGAQAALLFGSLTILWIALWLGSFVVLTVSAFGFSVFQRLAQAVLVAGLVLWLIALWNAWQGRSWRVPIIADVADRLSRV